MYMYSLTHMTGKRKNIDRTMVVATVEVNRFSLIVTLLSVVASIIPSLVVASLLGPLAAYALVIPVLFIGAGMFFVDRRQRSGLQLRPYEAMWDKRQAKRTGGIIFVCSQPLVTPELRTVIQTVVRDPHFRPIETDLFDTGTGSVAVAAHGRSVRKHKSQPRAVRSFLA